MSVVSSAESAEDNAADSENLILVGIFFPQVFTSSKMKGFAYYFLLSRVLTMEEQRRRGMRMNRPQ